MADDDTKADSAEEKVEASRGQLDRHLDELGEKFAPANLASAVLEKLNPMERLKNAVRAANDRPVMTAILGAALTLIAFRRWWRKKAAQP